MSYELSKKVILEKLKVAGTDSGNPFEQEKIQFYDVKKITTFAPLAEFKNLKSLIFGTTDGSLTIPSLEGLGEATSLEMVTFMSKTKVSSGVEELSRLPGLKKLGLYNLTSPVPGDLLQPLETLESVSLSKEIYQLIQSFPGNLTEVSLGFDSMAALPPWKESASVETLRVGGMTCQLEDLNSLKCFPRLRRLFLASPKKLRDVGMVSRLTDLQELDMNFAGVEDLRPLINHPRLEILKFRGCGIKKLQEIYPNKNLKVLYLEKSTLGSLEGIKENLPNLELLWIWDSKVKDLSPLAGMTGLKDLDVTLLKPKSWDFLKTLTGLEVLDLCKTSFSDWSLLEPLKNLKKLRVKDSLAEGVPDQYQAILKG